MPNEYTGPAGKTLHLAITKHQIPTCHIREYPRALADNQEDVLQLAIKQYTPLVSPDNSSSTNAAVTIIGAHANGFPKVSILSITHADLQGLEFHSSACSQELYEPLWDDLYERLHARGVHINSIWIADIAHQGDSGVLNEELLGNDPSWLDHSRDLFLMVNHFRQHMKRPIMGIGHSMGGVNLINLALMHPRLFTTLVLIDPPVQRTSKAENQFVAARASAVRRDRWPSRRDAEATFKRSKFYQKWDPRVMTQWIEHGLRDLPTSLFPETREPSREVTLKTTKHHEVFTFMRPNPATPDHPDPQREPNPVTHPDADPAVPITPLYRPEPIATFRLLPHLRPSVLYVFADESELSAPELKAEKLAQTGVGVGGSGGVARGRVAEYTFCGVGHLIPMEVVSETAQVAADWIVPELRRWGTIEAREREEWGRVPRRERSVIDRAQMLGRSSPGKGTGTEKSRGKL
jgi:pimeloyl-ACP methyl ester carboxylesterase